MKIKYTINCCHLKIKSDMNLNFWNFIKENISGADLERLHEILGCSKYRLTTLQRGQEDFYPNEVQALAKLIKMKPIELIMEHGIGRKYVTLQMADELVKEEGLEVGLLAHSA